MERRGLAGRVLDHDGGGLLGLEGQSAAERLPSDDAQRVEVAPAIELATRRLFRAHVVDRAEDPAITGDVRRPGIAGDSEVRDDHPAGASLDHQVFRLDVAVDHPAGMGVREGPGGLPEHSNHLARRNPASGLDPLGEGLAVDVPHAEKRQVADLVGAKDRHDVGVGELRRGPGLPEEPLAKVRIVERRREHLDRHQAVQPQLPGEIDDSHAAATELPLDDILTAQPVVDHSAEVPGHEAGYPTA